MKKTLTSKAATAVDLLREIERRWLSISCDAQVPVELNDPDLWDRVREITRR